MVDNPILSTKPFFNKALKINPFLGIVLLFFLNPKLNITYAK
jgi:hypothetical protein